MLFGDFRHIVYKRRWTLHIVFGFFAQPTPKSRNMRIMGEMSGKTASEGGFVILNGSKRAKKCKNRMNPENSSPNETRNGDCRDVIQYFEGLFIYVRFRVIFSLRCSLFFVLVFKFCHKFFYNFASSFSILSHGKPTTLS